MQEAATVIRVDDHQVWVETVRHGTCQACSAKSVCGHGLIDQVMGAKPHRVCVQRNLDVHAGDVVLIESPDSAITRAALTVYFLPLLMAIPVLLISQSQQWPEWLQLLSFAAIFIGAFLVLRYRFANGMDAHMAPRMLRRIDLPEQANCIELKPLK